MAIFVLRHRQEATVSHLFDLCEEKALPPAGCLSRAPPPSIQLRARALSRQSPQIKKSISRGDVHPNRVAVYPISTYKNKSACTGMLSLLAGVRDGRSKKYRTDCK